jgi:L-alanine-DL-glutamate epimerase-like enolase superfamily enzyme
VHSIEQPIKAGQPGLMAKLCNETPVDIALDEELIGVRSYNQKEELLSNIRPQYLILKPSLLGGFSKTMEWIKIAESMHIGWWITSALESNIGLNAICQFASFLDVNMPQGLGTGSLYQNNVNSPLEVIADKIWYNPEKDWEL